MTSDRSDERYDLLKIEARKMFIPYPMVKTKTIEREKDKRLVGAFTKGMDSFLKILNNQTADNATRNKKIRLYKFFRSKENEVDTYSISSLKRKTHIRPMNNNR